MVIPTRNQTAKTTAEAFFNHFVAHYGMPQRIHSDLGATFQSNLMKELCQHSGIGKSRTTPYHPMGNGQCERFNRTLLSMLGTLEQDQKRDWKSYVTPLVHAYNATRNETTGYSPFFLMYGREPRLPVDLAFGVETGQHFQSRTKYAEDLRKRLQESYNIAINKISSEQNRQKGGYDRRVRGGCVAVGGRVLVKNLAFNGKHKLSDKWEEDVYLVLDRPNIDVPVFVVQKENGEGRKRTLHRNLLLHIGHLSSNDTSNQPDMDNKPIPAPRNPRRGSSNRIAHLRSRPVEDTSDSEDSDEDVLVCLPQRTTSDSDPAIGSTISGTDGPTGCENHESTMDTAESDSSSLEDIPSTPGAEDTREEAETTCIPTDDEVEPPPTIHRSIRTKRKPARYRDDDFVYLQAASASSRDEPSWSQKAKYLASLAPNGLLVPGAERILEAVLAIVTKPD